MKLRTMSVNVVLIWLLVLSVGCGQKPVLNQDISNSLAIQTDNHLTFRHGPAPDYLLMSITPQQQEYKQADEINLAITIKNVWNEPLHIANNPNILVGPATISTDKYDPIAIPELGDRTLKPGETIRTSATWKQRGEPGLYQVQFGDIDLGNTTLGGGGNRFFVKYPSDKVQTKTIESEAQIKLPTEDGDLTFVLKRIDMNEHETKVYFEFDTNLEAPMGFQISIASPTNDIHPFDVEQNQPKKGIIEGVAKFNPTTNDVTKLQIIISDWSVVYKGVRTDILKGPWKIDVPII